jgi:hypothetical protein
LKSVSIVGLEKNTGKTETINFLLKTLNKRVGITSIGLDGEPIDQLTSLPKPHIGIVKGTIFATAEKYYKLKRFHSEILSVDDDLRTPLGRIVVSKALENGEVILAGPQKVKDIKTLIEKMLKLGAQIVLIDGALSRLTPASPVITDAMILATGAAVSLNINELVKKTKFVTDLIQLEKENNSELENLTDGIYAIDERAIKLSIRSLLSFEECDKPILDYGKKFYICGALGESFLKYLSKEKNLNEVELIVKDFTKIFVKPETYYTFIQKGGKIKVLHSTKLLAITINPISPYGYTMDSDEIIKRLKEVINIPIINVREGQSWMI